MRQRRINWSTLICFTDVLTRRCVVLHCESSAQRTHRGEERVDCPGLGSCVGNSACLAELSSSHTKLSSWLAVCVVSCFVGPRVGTVLIVLIVLSYFEVQQYHGGT